MPQITDWNDYRVAERREVNISDELKVRAHANAGALTAYTSRFVSVQSAIWMTKAIHRGDWKTVVDLAKQAFQGMGNPKKYEHVQQFGLLKALSEVEL